MAVETSLRSDAAWSAGGRASAAIVNLAALAIYARLLGPEEFGIFALIQAAAVILHNGLFHWLEAGTLRFVSGRMSGGADPAPALARGYRLTILCIVALLAMAALLADPRILVLIISAVGMALGEAAANGAAEFHRAAGKLKGYGVLVLCRAVFATAGATTLVMLQAPEAVMAIAGHAAACLLVGVAGLALRPRAKVSHLPTLPLGDLAAYGWPLSVSVIARLAAQRLDRFIVAFLLGLEAAGIYALAFDFARRAIGVPLAMVNLAIYPRMAAAMDAGDNVGVNRLARLNWRVLSLAGLPLAAGLAAISPVLLPVLFGDAFGGSQAAAVAALAALSILLEAIRVQHFDLAFMLRRDTAILWVVSMLLLVATAITVPLLAAPFGMAGAALAAPLAGTLTLALTVLSGRKRYPLACDLRQTAAVAAGAGMMAVAVLATTRLTDGIAAMVLGMAVGILVFGIFAMTVPATGLRDLVRKES
jgi:O-antigen/teichoic acid export membrane protein